MGAMSELAINIVEVCYPDDEDKQDRMMAALKFGCEGALVPNPLTPENIRAYYEQHHRWPNLDIEEAVAMVKEFHKLNQPDPVCHCGKTSEGICPRCGENMG
jgi:hypothetical protein